MNIAERKRDRAPQKARRTSKPKAEKAVPKKRSEPTQKKSEPEAVRVKDPTPPKDRSKATHLPREDQCHYPFDEEKGQHLFCGCTTILATYDGKIYKVPAALRPFKSVYGYCFPHALEMLDGTGKAHLKAAFEKAQVPA